jgi:hypothetical protein
MVIKYFIGFIYAISLILTVIYFIVLLVNPILSKDSTSRIYNITIRELVFKLDLDDCHSYTNSYCAGRLIGWYGSIFSPIIICILSGYFFHRKKKQISSDNQKITDEDHNTKTNSDNIDDSIESKLEKLKSLLEKDLITEEEFNTKKQKLIDEI